MQAVATLFSEIKDGCQMAERREDQMMPDFETHANGILGLLNEGLGVLGSSEAVARKAEVLLAKHGMYDVCFKRLIKLVPSKFAHPLSALSLARARLIQELAQASPTLS